jgi:MazG family protein
MRLSKKQKASKKTFLELIKTMAHLRGPGGCPWDKEQNHSTLIPYLFSEAKELELAVKKKDWKNMKEELGDLLLQVIFHSQIAEEDGRFSITDVIKEINKKLKRRHPHVFGGKKLRTPHEVILQWKKIKLKEKKLKKTRKK